MVVLALAAFTCLAAVVLAGFLLWRSAPTPTAGATPTTTPANGSTLTGEDAGAIPTVLPPAIDDVGPSDGGLTDSELRAQVWSTITSFYDNVRGCTEVSSAGIQVSQEPDAAGSWEETWDVSACSQSAELKIKFTVAPDGGIFYDITE